MEKPFGIQQKSFITVGGKEFFVTFAARYDLEDEVSGYDVVVREKDTSKTEEYLDRPMVELSLQTVEEATRASKLFFPDRG